MSRPVWEVIVKKIRQSLDRQSEHLEINRTITTINSVEKWIDVSLLYKFETWKVIHIKTLMVKPYKFKKSKQLHQLVSAT